MVMPIDDGDVHPFLLETLPGIQANHIPKGNILRHIILDVECGNA